MNSADSNHELERLIDEYLDGTINAAHMARLNALLIDDAHAQRIFTEHLNLDSALAAYSAGYNGTMESSPSTPPEEYKRSLLITSLIPACLLVIGFVLWFSWSRSTDVPFATVEKTIGIESLSIGDSLHQELHEIQAGTIELVTSLGARVVIEAPAAFHFETIQRLHLQRGRLAADVPPSAKGFTVITPDGSAIDLGTRFGVDVSPDGPSEIHVFQGEVIAQAHSDQSQQNLRDGQALAMNPRGSSNRELRSSAFIQPDEVRDLNTSVDRRSQSEAVLDQLRRDPALIALLDFESPSADHPGTYRMVQGRWPGSQAPEFIHVGDHLKLDIGGAHPWPQLTLAAWVRIDRLGAPYQSLLHTDGWHDQSKTGQVHWMILKDATMRLALYGNVLESLPDKPAAKGGFPDSLTPVLPEQGRWVHLASVYDSTQRTVRFYFNGQLDRKVRLRVAHPARLGPAQIGNWDTSDRKLSGRIDEFLILGRAMTDAEIQKLFSDGNPYR